MLVSQWRFVAAFPRLELAAGIGVCPEPQMEAWMLRVLLIVVVVLIGFDAVVHNGYYTRNMWANLVGLTDSAVDSARQNTRGS